MERGGLVAGVGSQQGVGQALELNKYRPIRDSVPRYYNGAFPEGAKILAPPVLESPTILQIVAAARHRGMHACRGQFRIDQSSQSEMSRLKFITD